MSYVQVGQLMTTFARDPGATSDFQNILSAQHMLMQLRYRLVQATGVMDDNTMSALNIVRVGVNLPKFGPVTSNDLTALRAAVQVDQQRQQQAQVQASLTDFQSILSVQTSLIQLGLAAGRIATGAWNDSWQMLLDSFRNRIGSAAPKNTPPMGRDLTDLVAAIQTQSQAAQTRQQDAAAIQTQSQAAQTRQQDAAAIQTITRTYGGGGQPPPSGNGGYPGGGGGGMTSSALPPWALPVGAAVGGFVLLKALKII